MSPIFARQNPLNLKLVRPKNIQMGRQSHLQSHQKLEFGQTMQELFDDCKRGQTQRVQSWIAQKGKKQRSPLSFLRSNAPSMPDSGWLCGLRQPSTSHTLLHLVALNGHGELARFLVQRDEQLVRARDRKGCLPLHLAAWNGHSTILEILLAADPESINSVDNAKQTALHLATLNGNGQAIRLLLQRHIDARLRNAHQECALDIAVRTGKANICRLLLIHWPNLALQCASDCCASPPNCFKCPWPIYPLHIAARLGHGECLVALLENGFDPNYLEKEGTALHAAIKQGQAEMTRILVEKGADKNIKDSEGRTAMELLEAKLAEKGDGKEGERILAKWGECGTAILTREGTGGKGQNAANWQSLMPDRDRSWQRNNGPIPSPRSTIDQNDCPASSPIQRSTVSPPSNPSPHPPSSPCCVYQPLPQPNNAGQMPSTNYQNVPKWGLLYDNAPIGSAAQKKWHHSCGGKGMSTTNSESTLHSTSTSFTICGLSDHKNRPKPNEFDQLRMESEEFLGIENGGSLFHSPCSTLGRITASPPNSPYINGKKEGAPLARADEEELTTSAGTTQPNTPERLTKSPSKSQTPMAESAPAIGEICSLPVASCNSIVTLAISASSSGSLPLISQFSSTPPAALSPTPKAFPSPFPTKPPPSSWSPLSANASAAGFPKRPNFQSQAKPLDQQRGQAAFGAAVHANHHPKQLMEGQRGIVEGKEFEEEIRWKEIDDLLKNFQRESFYSPNQNRIDGIKTNPAVGLAHKSAANSLANSRYSNSPPSPCSALLIVIWLMEEIGLEEALAAQIGPILFGNGFDRVEFMVVHYLKGALNTKLMGEMGIERKCQLRICRHLNDPLLPECIPTAAAFEFVSDWLNSLNLLDQLGCFSLANLTSSADLVAANLSRGDLEKMGISQLGHISRIIRSLELARKFQKMQSLQPNNIDFHSSNGNTRNSSSPQRECHEQSSASADESKASSTISRSSRAASISPQIDIAELRIKLVEGCVRFTAHYLGVAEISNVEGTEDCRRAMNAAKGKAGHLAEVPHVVMEISVLGVNILDEKGKAICYQPISNIQVVCQDELDLNCFAYIFKDGDKDFSHVFCVLTAIIAKEIIVTLGEAFNLAYKIALEKEAVAF